MTSATVSASLLDVADETSVWIASSISESDGKLQQRQRTNLSVTLNNLSHGHIVISY